MLAIAIMLLVLALAIAAIFGAVAEGAGPESLLLLAISLIFCIAAGASFVEYGRGDPVSISWPDKDVIYRYWGSTKIGDGNVVITLSDPTGDLTTIVCSPDKIEAKPGDLVQMEDERLVAVPSGVDPQKISAEE